MRKTVSTLKELNPLVKKKHTGIIIINPLLEMYKGLDGHKGEANKSVNLEGFMGQIFEPVLERAVEIYQVESWENHSRHKDFIYTGMNKGEIFRQQST